MLRKLTNEEITKLASKTGVKSTAVENFLFSVTNNDNEWAAYGNACQDAKSYRWNAATLNAVKAGIRKASCSIGATT